MEGKLDFKAIFIGFIVDVVATATIGGIIGGIAGGLMVASMMRGPGGVAAMNALAANPAAMTQQMSALMNSPLLIVATIASGVLGSLIGGYVTGLMARGAETKNAAAMGAFGLVFALIMFAISIAAGGSVGTMGMGAGITMPPWVTLVSALLTIPAAVCGGALCSMRNAPAPQQENFDQFR